MMDARLTSVSLGLAAPLLGLGSALDEGDGVLFPNIAFACLTMRRRHFCVPGVDGRPGPAELGGEDRCHKAPDTAVSASG
jgi:hypothetical protein